MSRAIAPLAPTGAQRMARSASESAASISPPASSTMFSSRTRAKTCGEESSAAISRTAWCALAARAMEEPMRPRPISVSLSKSGSSCIGASQEIFERRHDALIGLVRTNREPQELRHAIGIDRAQHEAATREEFVGVGGAPSLRVGKADRKKIAGAWQDFEP